MGIMYQPEKVAGGRREFRKGGGRENSVEVTEGNGGNGQTKERMLKRNKGREELVLAMGDPQSKEGKNKLCGDAYWEKIPSGASGTPFQ